MASVEKLGYILIGSVAVLWLGGMIAGMIAILPYGLLGLALLAGGGLLFAKVLKERLASSEDDHYSRNVHQ